MAALAAAQQAQQTAEVGATDAAMARETLAANLAAQIAAATAAAQATPTETATPTSLPTPEDTSPVATSTATPSPTLDLAATATAKALRTVQAQLAQVQATQTVAAQQPIRALPPLPPAPVRLLFVQGGSPSDPWKHALAIISAEGVIERNLVLYAGAPAWSPADDQIAFIGEQGINSLGGAYGQFGPGIWLIDPEGRNSRQLVKSDNVDNLAWSPDGSKIAYEIEPPGQVKQVVVIDAGEGRQLSQFTGQQPAWDPDSQLLAIHRCSQGACGLWQVNFAGGEAVQLTSGSNDTFPSWSPDGRYLAFASNQQGNDYEIYLMRLSDGQVDRLTSRPGSDITPVFSPTGREVYFRTDAFGGWRINAIRLDGSGERLVREGVGYSASWGMARPAVR